MITRVRVKNFRSLADIDVELGPLTVLVGRNGAGKSAFVDVLRFVRDAVHIGLDDAIMERGGIASLRRWQPRNHPEIEIGIEAASTNFWGYYGFALQSKTMDEYQIKWEECRVGLSREHISDGFLIRDGRWEIVPKGIFDPNFKDKPINEASELYMSRLVYFNDMHVRMYSTVAHSNFYSIFPNTLRSPQKPQIDYPLHDDGHNLASVLRKMDKHAGYYADILTALNHIVSSVKDIRIRSMGGYLVTQLEHQMNDGASNWFDLSQESDGTVRTLALLVALYQSSPTSVRRMIGVEEPELTVHPGALDVLSDVIREAACRNQILLTTQSPDLIARFAANELRVVEQEDGITRIGPLDDTQREVINDQLFSAGDLLRIEGLHRAPVTITGERGA